MSFFGGGGSLKQKKYIVTSADLANAIVIAAFDANIFAGIVSSDSAYDGKVKLQAQQIDNAWLDIDYTSGPSFAAVSTPSFGTNTGGWVNGQTTNLKIPFILRAIIDTKATLGSCDVIINFL